MKMKLACGWLLAGLMTANLWAADIVLPPPDKSGGMPLMEAITARQSRRDMTDKPLTAQQFSDLCYVANGISRGDGKRTIPTARNVQDLELFVAMADGLFRYDAARNLLVQVGKKDLRPFTGKQRKMHTTAPVVLIYVSDFDKFKGFPEDMKVFYAANHAGYASQNVYLYAASAKLATVVCNLVDKPVLAREMRLGPQYRIQLTQPVGYPPAK